MFQDESRFGRITDPRRCWAPAGVRPETPCQIVREYSYVYAAISPHDGTLDSLILPQVNTQIMSLFLREVANRHPDEFIIMVMDQAGWHRANALQLPENMKIIFLPPYSPELNPVEHLGDELREKWFANKVFPHLDAVEDLLTDALCILEKDKKRVASFAGFDWIISINLNAN